MSRTIRPEQTVVVHGYGNRVFRKVFKMDRTLVNFLTSRIEKENDYVKSRFGKGVKGYTVTRHGNLHEYRLTF